MQDVQEAREQMKRDVLATPPELLADLLQALASVRMHRADLIYPTTTQPKE